jgi:NADPH:quinone reductase-like Zn-dependent oxidoreductase
MRAIIYTGAGGTEVLALRDVPTPEPGPGQVRVRIRAAGLNRADILQRRGSYPAPPGWPADIPGLEYAGEVDAVGPGATRRRPGDRVMGLAGGGAHAEYVVVHDDETLPVPPGMSWVDAAAIPEAFLTALDALTSRGRLERGETVLIHAAGSGVGTAAVQLARTMGATVMGTSRTPAKLEELRPLGLEVGIDTSRVPFREQVTVPVDVILDVLGGPAFRDNLALLAPRGRLVMLGHLQGSMTPETSLELILRRRLEIIGSVMRTREHDERVRLAVRFMQRVLPLFGMPRESRRSLAHPESGEAAAAPPREDGEKLIYPVVHAAFPFTAAAAAHAAMERNEGVGKIVLCW